SGVVVGAAFGAVIPKEEPITCATITLPKDDRAFQLIIVRSNPGEASARERSAHRGLREKRFALLGKGPEFVGRDFARSVSEIVRVPARVIKEVLDGTDHGTR